MPHPFVKLSHCLAWVAMSLGLLTPTVQAGVIIDGTRQIYPQLRREITVRVSNDDQHAPRLIQAWLDKGDQHQRAELIDVPFSLSPPVFRLDAGKSQAMRLSYTKEPLPTDRESLFWLNVLEVPPSVAEFDPTVEEGGRNHLRFAFRIRTKVFFRPVNLPGKPEEAPAQLRWSLLRNAQGYALQVHNPSAYHITFNEVALSMGSHADAERLPFEEGMVVPGGILELPVRKGVKSIPAGAQVQFTYINDFGAFSLPQRAALQL
ncbi:fimbria/pilus periplasmic chaperone [Pseudomonas sp. CCM 7891]|uniref:Fimbria/pilus periplasmic chaperone n=1 Tax=Pseudomonas karstica TaxID=1055468 RepID=A0A7X2UW26_9PSED|nr:molecular chaperone [Pseudomonas karstica]MTD18251.1 fimbria/pilus periplasmic chaperone [Pseudomonas karstica]